MTRSGLETSIMAAEHRRDPRQCYLRQYITSYVTQAGLELTKICLLLPLSGGIKESVDNSTKRKSFKVSFLVPFLFQE